MFFTALTAITAVLLGIYWMWKSRAWVSIKLPGPKPAPLIGNILELDTKRPYITIEKWRKEHGEVFKFRLLGSTIVVLASYEAIYEALVKRKNDFAGRPKLFRFGFLSNNYQDLGFDSPNPKWTQLRKSLTKYMKMYDTGLHRLENITNEVIKGLVQEIKDLNGSAFDPRDHIYNSVTNIMFVLLIGKKFSRDSLEFNMFKTTEQLGIYVSAPVGKGTELDVFPWLRYLGSSSYETIKKFNSYRDIFYNKLVDHVFGDDTNEASESSLLKHLKGHEGELGEARVRNGLGEILLAGTTTTTITFTILLNILLQNPTIQKRIQDEIDSVIGDQRQPELRDKDQMPYSRATIFEALRYSSILPLGLPHCTTADTHIGGVSIPKNTQVLMSLWSLHSREEYWDSPGEFKPERFLDDEGDLVPADHINRKRLLPFGAGARVCIGETMARNRLFLMLTNVLQNFDLVQDPEKGFVSYDPRTYIFGLASQPLHYTVKMIPRNNEAF